MNYERAIELVESEWDMDDGFFGQIRAGSFDPACFQRALQKVSSIRIEQEAQLPRRLVSLLWSIPQFMEWQVERVREHGGDVAAYADAISTFTNVLERLLGVP